MLNSYSKTKSKLSEIINDLGRIAIGEHSKERIQLIGNKLEDNIFSLVVVGQFKRGKTTFINTFLGQNLLPTSIVPLTSIITVLKYDEKLGATALMSDGSKKEIPTEDIQLYVTEKYNPKNEKGIDRVEITFPSAYLKSGVQIIDTPGVASIHSHNTKTTYEYLPQADAAIFLVGADPPLTQAELVFLRDLKKIVSKIFFIQNKIDIVDEVNRRESLAFTKKIIEEQSGFKDIKIYPLSAITKIGFPEFERELEQFLLNEKGNVLLQSIAEKVRGVISEDLLLAELEEKSLNIPLQELEKKIADFRLLLNEINQECLDSGRLLTEEVKTLQIDILQRDLEKFKEEKTKWLTKKVDEFSESHKKENNEKFIESVNNFLATKIREIFSAWRKEEEEALKQQLEKTLSRFVNRINAVFEKIFISSSETFGITQRVVRVQETLPAEIEFRWQTEDETDMLSMTLDFAKKIMPKGIAHRIIWGEARERAEMLIDRHCGKLRYDFSQRMDKLVRDYKMFFNSSLEATQKDVLCALEVGLRTRQKTEVEIAKQEVDLRNRLAKLIDLQRLVRKTI